MIWQDIVISLANLVFVISLVPQVIYGYRKKKGMITLRTSGPTFAALYIMAIAYFTLNLYYSAALGTITATLWLILFIQKIKYDEA